MFGCRGPHKPQSRRRRKRKPPWSDPSTRVTLTPFGWRAFEGMRPLPLPWVTYRAWERLIRELRRLAEAHRRNGGVS